METRFTKQYSFDERLAKYKNYMETYKRRIPFVVYCNERDYKIFLISNKKDIDYFLIQLYRKFKLKDKGVPVLFVNKIILKINSFIHIPQP